MHRFGHTPVAITGGNHGIGRAIARAYDHEGGEVAIPGRVGLVEERIDEMGRRTVTRV